MSINVQFSIRQDILKVYCSEVRYGQQGYVPWISGNRRLFIAALPLLISSSLVNIHRSGLNAEMRHFRTGGSLVRETAGKRAIPTRPASVAVVARVTVERVAAGTGGPERSAGKGRSRRARQEAAAQQLLELGEMATLPVPPNYATRDAMLARLRDLQSALEAEGVRHASIFGSIARGDDAPESDIDIILDLDPDRHIGLFAFTGIAQFLESELGRSVDLGTMCSLRRPRHNEILDELAEAF